MSDEKQSLSLSQDSLVMKKNEDVNYLDVRVKIDDELEKDFAIEVKDTVENLNIQFNISRISGNEVDDKEREDTYKSQIDRIDNESGEDKTKGIVDSNL